jgi:hypothetical protein
MFLKNLILKQFLLLKDLAIELMSHIFVFVLKTD